jgi:hypothetical protein
MAEPTILRRNFYVYFLERLDGTPFYVGRGTGNRWLMHEYKAKRGRSYKDNIICQIRDAGLRVPKRKIAEGLTDTEANELEIELIAKLGRHPNGPLANMTDGGEGIVEMPAESEARRRAKLKGRKKSDETRERLRRAASNPSAETRRKMSEKARAKIVSEETRQRQSVARKGRPKSAETRLRMRAAALLRSPEQYQKSAAARRGRTLPPEVREKIRATLTGQKMSDEARAKMSESQKRRWIENPRPPITEETRQKMRNWTRTEQTREKIRQAQFNRPPKSAETRAKISAALRARPPISEETRQKKRASALAAIERKRQQSSNQS